MDGVINTIKKYLEDIINKVNQISISVIKNKSVENTSVEFVSMVKTYKDFNDIRKASSNKDKDIVTLFEFNGNGYIEKFKILDLLSNKTYSSGHYTQLKDVKIIIDDEIFISIEKITPLFGVFYKRGTDHGYLYRMIFNGTPMINTVNYDYYTFMSGEEINIPINKYIKKNIKCECIPQNFEIEKDSSDYASTYTPIICSAWIEHRK